MNWINRFALLSLCFVAPALADNVVDISGSNLGISGGVTLNFSFEFDATTDTVLGTPSFTATGNPTLVADFNVSQLTFQSDPTNSAGVTSIDFSGPAGGGGTTYLALGPNGLSTTNPVNLLFPNIGTYTDTGELVLLDAGVQCYGGEVVVTSMPSGSASVPEPSAGLLLLLGLVALIAANVLPSVRRQRLA
jgi:hypothetical protein